MDYKNVTILDSADSELQATHERKIPHHRSYTESQPIAQSAIAVPNQDINFSRAHPDPVDEDYGVIHILSLV